MNQLVVLILGLVALLAGLALGWFFGSRPVADLRLRHSQREAEVKEHAERLARMAPELATMSERAARADGLAVDLDRARAENARFAAERAGFEEQKRLLEESRANLIRE